MSVSTLRTLHSEAASPPSIWTLLWNTDGYGDGAPAAPALGEEAPRHRRRRGSAADGCTYPFRKRMWWTRDDGGKDEDEDEDEDSADTETHANSQPPTAALPSMRRGQRPFYMTYGYHVNGEKLSRVKLRLFVLRPGFTHLVLF
ncbi:hypothetical protein JMJ77_0007843 [Colletotrichum scovillei]|uniref:Uncharacterized protein n=1 Tax=Colletotrichum scovillei TaxID=1209932 RepID=A0A9P7RDM7_9PEZI|nr:hypothetical protein JMJ77_0007843 [Colletotrichum scovillei]KAG7074853.1 hypothetical protein JMJ76_0011321 [Colletotrichum scovillei]KAG7081894.1 hypothetical protein JMJ78_0004006 [Colletotrichum scovillei]